jgi:hypothetical protein
MLIGSTEFCWCGHGEVEEMDFPYAVSGSDTAALAMPGNGLHWGAGPILTDFSAVRTIPNFEEIICSA